MKRIKLTISDNWKPFAVISAVIAATIGIFIFRLTTLTQGVSEHELFYIQKVADNNVVALDVIRSAAWMPYNAVLLGLQFITNDSNVVFAVRGISVALGLIAVAAMYRLLKWWHSPRIAIIGTALFAFSTWMLMISRLATPDILYIMPIILMAGWLGTRNGHRALGMSVTMFSAAICLYIPGLIWVIIPALLLQRKAFLRQLRALSPGLMFSLMGITILLCVPLLVALSWPSNGITSLEAARGIMAIPSTAPDLSLVLKNLWETVIHLFISGGNDPALYVGKAPLVSFAVTIFFGLGLYDTIRHIRLDRSKILLISLVVGLILVSLGTITITVLLPVVFLIAISGIRHLLSDWLRIFPRNPVARTVGIAVVSVIVGLAVAYQLFAYFVAWPHTPATKAAFNRKIS